MTPKLVIFDVDGTLVDSQNSIVASMTAAFGALGRPTPARNDLLSIVGLSLPQAFQILAPWAEDNENQALVQAYKDSFVSDRAGGREGAPLYPGARAALEGLASRDDIVLGVATGKSKRGLDILIENHDLHGFFQTQQVADHHPSKPHPAMVLAALSEVGVDPSDAVMIGDTTFDMDMAAAANVPGVGVTWGYHSVDSLHRSPAVAVIKEFNALERTIMEIWNS